MKEYLETKTRDDGTSYVSTTDGAPEWFREAVRSAHDGEMPNDWRYETIEAICEYVDGETDRVVDYDLEGDEIGYALADVYTADLVAWLAGNISRTGYSDTEQEEWASDCDTLVERVRMGQIYCITQMASVLLEARRATDS